MEKPSEIKQKIIKTTLMSQEQLKHEQLRFPKLSSLFTSVYSSRIYLSTIGNREHTTESYFGDLTCAHTNKGLPGPGLHNLQEYASFPGTLSGNGRANKSNLWWNILL